MASNDSRVVIDSRSRSSSSSSSSDAIFQLATPIPLGRARRVKLVSFLSYATMYTVTSLNNLIDFEENATVKLATITPGFYNATTLAAAVKTALDTASGGFATFTVSYSSTTGKYTVSSTQSFELLFATGANAASSAFDLLGFTNAAGTAGVDTAAGTSAVAPYVADLSGPSHLFIQVSEFNSHHRTSADAYFSFCIPNSAAQGQVSTFAYGSDYDQSVRLPDSATHLRSFTVRICDYRGRVVDLNNSEWSMVLQLCA